MARLGKTHYLLSALTVVLLVVCFSSMEPEVDFYTVFCALALISTVWLLLPLLNYLRYLKESSEYDAGAAGLRTRKCILIALTVTLSILCFVNLHGEVRFNTLLMSQYDGTPLSNESLIAIAVIWLFVPLLNFIEGMRSVNEKRLPMALVIAVYYFLWMLYFALNGTNTDEANYESRRLYGQPIAMILFSPVVLYGEFCLRRFEKWLKIRTAGKSDP